MKRFVVVALCACLLISCSGFWDKFIPHHSFDIDNNSSKKIFFSGVDVVSYKYMTESQGENWPMILLYRNLYKNKGGKREISITPSDTSSFGIFFWDRIEKMSTTDDGHVIFLAICYVDDMYAVYNEEKDIVPLWVYSYTLEDLQKYDWVVPFPDDSGTIKCEYYEYNINDYTWPNR